SRTEDTVPINVESMLKNTKGSGNPLKGNTKAQMEKGFGVDFSQINIHTSSSAVQMSKSLGADAFTNSNDIYFNSGKYNPSTKEGKHLLAHELTHTQQQS